MSTVTSTTKVHQVLDGLDEITRPLEDLYRDLHSHPELSNQEHRTAAKGADELEKADFEVTAGVGGTGVSACLEMATAGR